MTTPSSWQISVTELTCSSALIGLSTSSDSAELPLAGNLSLGDYIIPFTIDPRQDDITLEDVETDGPTEEGTGLESLKQRVLFDSDLVLPDGIYPIYAELQSEDLDNPIEAQMNTDELEIKGCDTNSAGLDSDDNQSELLDTVLYDTNSESTDESEDPTSDSQDADEGEISSKQAVENQDSTSQQADVESTVYDPSETTIDFPSQTETDQEQVSPTPWSNQDSEQAQLEASISEDNSQEVKTNIESAVPAALLVCLLGVCLFFIIRRCRQQRRKQDRTFYAFNNKTEDSILDRA